MIRFRISTRIIELDASTKLSFEWKNSLLGFDSISLTRSLTFSIPKTRENEITFGMADRLALYGAGMRQRFYCEMLYDSGKVNGYLYVLNFNDRKYQACFVFGQLLGLQALKNLPTIRHIYFDDNYYGGGYDSFDVKDISGNPDDYIQSVGSDISDFDYESYRSRYISYEQRLEEEAVQSLPTFGLYNLINMACGEMGYSIWVDGSLTQEQRRYIYALGLLTYRQDFEFTVANLFGSGEISPDNQAYYIRNEWGTGAGILYYNGVRNIDLERVVGYVRQDCTIYVRYDATDFALITCDANTARTPDAVWSLCGYQAPPTGGEHPDAGGDVEDFPYMRAGTSVRLKKGDFFAVVKLWGTYPNGEKFVAWEDSKFTLFTYDDPDAYDGFSIIFQDMPEAIPRDSHATCQQFALLPDLKIIDLCKTIANLTGCGLLWDESMHRLSFANVTAADSVPVVLDERVVKYGQLTRSIEGMAQSNYVKCQDDTFVRDWPIINANLDQTNEMYVSPVKAATPQDTWAVIDDFQWTTDEDGNRVCKKNIKEDLIVMGDYMGTDGAPYMLRGVFSVGDDNMRTSIFDKSTTISVSVLMPLLEFMNIREKTLYSLQGITWLCKSAKWENGQCELTLVKI